MYDYLKLCFYWSKFILKDVATSSQQYEIAIEKEEQQGNVEEFKVSEQKTDQA